MGVRDTLARVAERQHHMLSRGHTRMLLGVTFVEVDNGGFQGQAAAFGHGILRVYGQVHDDLFDLPGIRPDQGRDFGQVNRDQDVFPDRAAQQLFKAGDDMIKIDGSDLQGLFAGKGQELLDQVTGFLAGLLNGLDCRPI